MKRRTSAEEKDKQSPQAKQQSIMFQEFLKQ
jgi:hypothetical protein